MHSMVAISYLTSHAITVVLQALHRAPLAHARTHHPHGMAWHGPRACARVLLPPLQAVSRDTSHHTRRKVSVIY